MSTIGFSTGAIAFDDFERALKILDPTCARAVELSALRIKELPVLLSALPEILPGLRQRYDYISFHAPTNFENEESVVRDLALVADLGINVIVHPDTIQDVYLWSQLGPRLCLENMDSRKSTGRTAEELREFYEKLPEAVLCFDIAHARQFDATMTEAVRIIEEFRGRLAQVHLSEVNSKGRHFAMSFAAKRAYEPFAEILAGAPVIIESVIDNDEIVGEIEKTEQLLRSQRPRMSRNEERQVGNHAMEFSGSH